MGDIKIVGVEKIQAKLKKNALMSDVKHAVQKNGDNMNTLMKKNTETAFTKGYTHGDTAGSINTEMSDGGLTATVGATTEYSEYVEHGTRFMEAEPFCEPAFNVQKEKFKKDMKRLVD